MGAIRLGERESGTARLEEAVAGQGGVNAAVFIEFLKRLMVGATHPIFLIVDRGPAHRAKKTKAFVETLGGKLRLFFSAFLFAG